MFRVLLLLFICGGSTACTAIRVNAPDQADWQSLERGVYRPEMRCTPLTTQATGETIGGLGMVVLGAYAISQADGFLGDVIEAQGVAYILTGAAAAIAGLVGRQKSAECARFNAAVEARFGAVFQAPADGVLIVAPPSAPGRAPASNQR